MNCTYAIQRLKSAFVPALAGIALGATVSSRAETLFTFDFNEGSGATVTNKEGTLTGALAGAVNPDSYPVSNPDSPSAGASDRSLTITDPEGYLLMDTTGAPEFADVAQPLTAEAWIFIPPDAVARNEGIVGHGASWKLGLRATGQLAFTLFGVVDVNSDIYPVPGVWTHVAAVYQPGVGVTYFIDGVETQSIEETRPMRASGYNWLGIGSAGRSEPINATIDRVRVHQAALTAEELDSVAATPKAPLTSTLAAFNFNESAAPYSSAGKYVRETVVAQDVYRSERTPQWTTETPSRKEGDAALVFDGNDRIVVDDPGMVVNVGAGDFTIQSWVKFGALPGARGVFFMNNGPGGAITASVTSDRHLFVTTLGLADTRSEAVIPDDGLWHHVAIVHRNGQDLRFYVDGVLGDTIPYTQGVLMTRTDTIFTIGAETGGGLPYAGSLDRLTFSNDAVAADALDYLAVPGVIPGIPELEIGLAVSVAWPTDATGFILESTTDLAEPRVWTTVGAAPVVISDKFYVMLPTPEEETFYRLVRPAGQ